MKRPALVEVIFYADGQMIPTHYAERLDSRPIRIDRILKLRANPENIFEYVCRCGENVVKLLLQGHIWYIEDDSMLYDEFRRLSLDTAVEK